MSSKFFGNRLDKNSPKQDIKKPVNKNNNAKRSTGVRKAGRGN
tara:strand:+ start:867 stop:995 length:129 start_codon:yes stop_codon:yes gene_type:complete